MDEERFVVRYLPEEDVMTLMRARLASKVVAKGPSATEAATLREEGYEVKGQNVGCDADAILNLLESVCNLRADVEWYKSGNDSPCMHFVSYEVETTVVGVEVVDAKVFCCGNVSARYDDEKGGYVIGSYDEVICYAGTLKEAIDCVRVAKVMLESEGSAGEANWRVLGLVGVTREQAKLLLMTRHALKLRIRRCDWAVVSISLGSDDTYEILGCNVGRDAEHALRVAETLCRGGAKHEKLAYDVETTITGLDIVRANSFTYYGTTIYVESKGYKVDCGSFVCNVATIEEAISFADVAMIVSGLDNR